MPVFRGIAKLDLQAPPGKALAGRLSYGPDHGGGEAFFVPSHPEALALTGVCLLSRSANSQR